MLGQKDCFLLGMNYPLPFFKKSYLFILAVLGLHCCMGVSLVVVSGGYSLVVVCGLLIVVASLVEEHGL